MIPDLDAVTGHLPLGRYRTSYGEIHSRFVTHSDFAKSPTRQAVWDGFIAYMTLWREMEEQLAADLGGCRLVMAVWLAGSFISGKHDPHNLDLTVLIDGELAEGCQGKPGIGRIIKLSKRESMLHAFRISPCVVRHHYFRSPFKQHLVGPDIEDYVILRGAFDDWWQRTRPEGEEKGEPTRASASARRGYLEVEA